jgi:hypothetical protein
LIRIGRKEKASTPSTAQAMPPALYVAVVSVMLYIRFKRLELFDNE